MIGATQKEEKERTRKHTTHFEGIQIAKFKKQEGKIDFHTHKGHF